MGFCLGHPFFQVLVTGQAEIRRSRQKKIVESGLMRVMALSALGGHRRHVGALGLFDAFPEIRVAVGTERSLRVYRHPLVIAPVSIVACQAVSSGKGRVVGAAYRFLHQIPMARGADPGIR